MAKKNNLNRYFVLAKRHKRIELVEMYLRRAPRPGFKFEREKIGRKFSTQTWAVVKTFELAEQRVLGALQEIFRGDRVIKDLFAIDL